MNVIGIDPGITGALAVYGPDGLIDVIDMPNFKMKIGRSARNRVDAVALTEWLEMQKMMGAGLAVLEGVGGRPKQGASSAFVLGHVVGMIYMACINHRIPVETVIPTVWKKVMHLPGKKTKGVANTDNDRAIMARTLEVFPDHAALFAGPQGGRRLDRCEAAMLAKYGHRHLLGSVRPDAEWRLSYQRADTGA